VLLTEALGSEILAHVQINAAPVVTEDVVEGAVVDEAEQVVAADLLGESSDGRTTTFVGRLDASSRVKPDTDIELVVDTAKLQFFDLDTGHAIHESAV
jgi:multiple sugar transport system ATP-binding protein